MQAVFFFVFFEATLCNMGDLSSPIRDHICAPALNQQQAIDKIKDSFDVDACTLNIEYVDMVTV